MLRSFSETIINKLPLRWQKTAKQFLKFGVTGVIGAIVDFSTYNIITRGFGWVSFYVVFGQKIIIANNISVFLAVISNFLFNKYWTFRDPSKKVGQQYAAYFAMSFVTWVINQLLVSFLTFRVPLMVEMFGGQADNMAKVLAIGAILFLNFFGSKFLIFRKTL